MKIQCTSIGFIVYNKIAFFSYEKKDCPVVLQLFPIVLKSAFFSYEKKDCPVVLQLFPTVLKSTFFSYEKKRLPCCATIISNCSKIDFPTSVFVLFQVHVIVFVINDTKLVVFSIINIFYMRLL